MIDPLIINLVTRVLADIYKRKVGKLPTDKHETIPALGDFCTRNEAFREELETVKSVIERYVDRKTHKRPLNILLSASPGGGKSFLAKQIEKTVIGRNTAFLEVYIPTFSDTKDLNNEFIKIASTKPKDTIPFVLFDEMDVDIKGQYLYGNFLGPIWDGQVYSDKTSLNLKPAVFLFAGSSAFPALSKKGIQNLARFEQKPISYEAYRNNWIKELEQRIDSDNAPRKLKDFVDRMDIFVCIPPTDPVLLPEEDVAKEFMDIVCNMVRKYFSKINTIELAAASCLIQELKYHPSRRVVESILQCASCDENGKKFLFNHLSSTVRNRYENDVNISNGKGVMIRI